jgi:hypothetical protein
MVVLAAQCRISEVSGLSFKHQRAKAPIGFTRLDIQLPHALVTMFVHRRPFIVDNTVIPLSSKPASLFHPFVHPIAAK